MKPFFLFLSLSILFSCQVFAQLDSSLYRLAEKEAEVRKKGALVVAIVDREQTTIWSFGTLSKKSEPGDFQHTVFELGGLSSTLTGILYARMEDAGLFSGSDPVSDHLPADAWPPEFQAEVCRIETKSVSEMPARRIPEWAPVCVPDPDSPRIAITMCNLAGNQSGLPLSPEKVLRWEPLGKGLQKKWEGPFTYNFVFDALSRQKLEVAPGRSYRWSNFGYSLLGEAMSRNANQLFDDLMREKVYEPLGMKDMNADGSGVPQGLNPKGKPVKSWKFGAFAPCIGLEASMADMVKIPESLFQIKNGDLYYAILESLKPRSQVQEGKASGLKAGYAWLIGTPGNPESKVGWMEGQTNGFASFMAIDVDEQQAVIILSNKSQPVTDLGFQLIGALTNDDLSRK